jgi:hypothetical protein
MRCFPRALLALGLSLVFTFTVADEVRAQRERSPVRIQRIKTSRVSPVGRGTGDWLEIRVEYDTAPKWLNRLDVTYYVLLESDEERGDFTLFTGEVSNVNIKRDAGHFGAMWMHPDTVERYGSVRSVAVVMKVDGRPVGMISDPDSQERWWERFTPTPDMLYNHYQLPALDDDKYPAIVAK